MRCSRVVVLFGIFIVACRTVSPEGSESKAPLQTATSSVDAAASIKPSASLQTMPHLVTPGPDEVLIRRGATARCPTTFELDEIDRAVRVLGRDTIYLVQEDLASLRQITTRTDRDGINSCCNQLEQLVQDTEIMNEDKPSTEPSIDKIRKITLLLCPAG